MNPTASKLRRRLGVLGVLSIATLLLALAAVLAWWNAGHGGLPFTSDLHLTVNGQEWHGADAAAVLGGHGWLAGLGALLVAAVVLVTVICVVALVVLVVLPLVLLTSVGLPLLLVAAILAVVFSPLWLFVVLLLWALRRGRRSTTMAA